MNVYNTLDNILSTTDVTTGGGSASALSGAMAAGLIGMVARLSIKKNYGLTPEFYQEIAAEADQLAEQLKIGAVEDAGAFKLIKDAYSLPKTTAEEKEDRATAIEYGSVQAALIPKENGWRCKRVHDLGLMLQDKSNPNAYSDLMIGIYLSNIGVKGCIMNIEANLSTIKNETVLEQLNEHIQGLRLMK